MNVARAWLVAALLAAPAAHAGDDYDALFQRHGTAYGVDWRLLKAVAQVESNLNARAENRADPSVGLMQILCKPARGTCANRLDIPGWPPRSRAQLFDPDYNVRIGALILSSNLRLYGFRNGIAAYNNWHARLTPPRTRLPNNDYVVMVLQRYKALLEDRTPQRAVGHNTRSARRALSNIPPSVSAPAGPRDGRQ